MIQKKNLPPDSKNVLSDIIAEIKQCNSLQNNNGLVYKLFDDFITYADEQSYRGRTIRLYVQSVKKLFIHLEVDMDHYKFKDKVGLPNFKNLKDEYPDNTKIRAIMTSAPPVISLLLQTMCDTGLEPVDTIQLKPKDIKFDEQPVRGEKEREKTGETLEFFLNKETADAIQQRIKNDNLGSEDYIFVEKFTKNSVHHLRTRYNTAVAKAGFGTLVKAKGGYYGKVEKIDGHKYGKYHMKEFKKRWFSLATAAGVPEYITQGTLGRRQYLDEYLRVPLEKKREFARKILRLVSVYREKNQEQALEDMGQLLGIEKLTPEQAAMLKEKLQWFLTKPMPKLKALFSQDEQA